LRSLSGNNTWNTTGTTITLAADATIGNDADTLTLERSSGTFITGTNHTLTLVGAGNFTIKNSLSLGTEGLTMNGTGLVALGVSASSSYTGDTTINSGTL
jgi:autotransporter-associated beta strand protein